MCGDETALPPAIPLFLKGEKAGERALFAWYHPPPAAVRRHASIVVCPPLGYEYMSSYRALRILAQRLAALGFDTLRIDYDGTGNSEGCANDPARVDAWLQTVDRAMAEVRRRAESDTVALVGLRAGAVLALRAGAAAGGVARIVLWSPFQSGRAYIRELIATARLSAQDDACDDGDSDTGINAEGYIFTAETLAELTRWTVGDLARSAAGEILLLDREDRPVGPAFGSALAAAGAAVTSTATDETAALLMPPHLSQLPVDALRDIEAWFRTWHPSHEPAPLSQATSPLSAAAQQGHERAVRFGAQERLFGILADRDEASDKPAVILFNTGAGHHVGPHRLYVPMARRWAERGHLVLRFDLGGLGDSAPPGSDLEGVAYPEHMLDDAREAIAFVRRHAPQRPVIVGGLCSGGWLAFQAARHNLGVDGVFSINAPFYLYDTDRQWLRESRGVARYQRAVRDPAKWAKVLRGRASYTEFTRLAAARLRRELSLRLGAAARREPANPLARDLCAIAGRGTSCLFAFSSGDNGLAYFLRHAQPTLRRNGVRDVMRHVVVENAGHTFRPTAAQHALTRLLDDFVAAPVPAATVSCDSS